MRSKDVITVSNAQKDIENVNFSKYTYFRAVRTGRPGGHVPPQILAIHTESHLALNLLVKYKFYTKYELLMNTDLEL